MKTENNPITEATAVKSNPEVKKNGMSPLWQSVLVGGVPGILIGAAGTVGAEAIANSASAEEQGEAILEESAATPTEIHEAHSVNDDMSFSEAFAAARAEVGPGGAFVWHGQVYDTYRGDDPEWQEMSDEDRAAHSHEILSQVHAAPYTPTEDEPEIVPVTEENAEVEDASTVEDADEISDVDVHIIGVGEIDAPDGSVAEIGIGTIDDHAAIFADTDGDNEVDTVLIDTNDNVQLELDEIYDATGAGITMDDLRDAVEPGMTEVVDENPDLNDGADPTLYI